MATMQWRFSFTLGLLSLGAALIGCQPPDVTPTSTPIAPAATLFASTLTPSIAPIATRPVIDPTPVPPTAPPSPITSATVPPTFTPALPTATLLSAPFRTADRLSVTQPWLLVEESEICGTSVSGYSLIAIDQAGGRTKLNRPITALATRPGLPPLLATCAADGKIAIIDTVRWKSVPLALPPGVVISQIVLSPNGKQAILQLDCAPYNRCPANAPARTQIANLQTGALHAFPGTPNLFSPAVTDRGPPPEPVIVMLLGWGSKGLYSRTTIFYKIPISTFYLVDPTMPQSSTLMLAQNSRYLVDGTHDRMLVVSSNDTSLTLYDMRQQTTQGIEQFTGIPASPVLAPDGTALAYFRTHTQNNGQSQRVELVVFDILRNTKTVLTDTLGEPNNLSIGGAWNTALAWSQDSQRITVSARSPQGVLQASLLTRDGTLLTTVPMPETNIWAITSDDQLILGSAEGHGVTWLPLRDGDAPYAPEAITVGYITAVIPPLLQGGAPLRAPTRTAPLPVTQLPTPVVPTATPP